MAIVLGRFFVPDTRGTRPTAGSTRSARCLSIVGLVACCTGSSRPDKRLVGPRGRDAGLGVGVVFLAPFVWWETHTAHPMLDVRFFGNPRFSAASATITLTFFALFGSTFLLTQYFQFVLGYSPLKAGMMIAPGRGRHRWSAPRGAPGWSDRFGTKRVVVPAC